MWGGYYRSRVYMAEARHLGLNVRPPHVNHSGRAFTLDPDDERLWMGLTLPADEAEPPEPTVEERAAWEREMLGQLVSVHPLKLVAEALASYDLTPSDRLDDCCGQQVAVTGVRLASQRFRANGEASMMLVDMEDRAGIYQVLWRGEALRRYREALSSREPVVIRGRVGADRQGLTLVLGREIQRVRGRS